MPNWIGCLEQVEEQCADELDALADCNTAYNPDDCVQGRICIEGNVDPDGDVYIGNLLSCFASFQEPVQSLKHCMILLCGKKKKK